MKIADSDERRRALDPLRSFCVSAPAGSGKTELLIQRYLCLLARVQAPEQVLDVHYRDLVANPMATVERIYAWLGGPMPDAARQAVAAALSTNTQHRYGKHRYQAEDFGLSSDSIDALFADYRQAFDL